MDKGMIIDWKNFRSMALEMTEKGYIPVFGKFCPELEEVVVESIFQAKKQGKKKVTLLINSNGGQNDSFTAIKSAMVISEMEFTGFVMSRARSNGFRLLQHCHNRLAVRNAELMFHWGQSSLGNSEIASLMDGQTWATDHIVTQRKAMAQEVHERTGVPLNKLYELARYDRMLTAQEGMELNFIDEIVEDTPQAIKKALENAPEPPDDNTD